MCDPSCLPPLSVTFSRVIVLQHLSAPWWLCSHRSGLSLADVFIILLCSRSIFIHFTCFFFHLFFLVICYFILSAESPPGPTPWLWSWVLVTAGASGACTAAGRGNPRKEWARRRALLLLWKSVSKSYLRSVTDLD